MAKLAPEVRVVLAVLLVLLVVGGAATAVWLLMDNRTEQLMARAEEKYRLGDVSDIKDGIELFNTVHRRKNVPSEVAAEALYRSAEGYMLLWQRTRDPSKIETAHQRLREIIDRYPLSPQARKALLLAAKANFLQGNYDTALAELDEVISRFSDPHVVSEAMNQKGEIYYAIGDYEKAVWAYSRRENINSDQATLGRAKAFLKMGQVEKAIDIYLDFLKYNPQSPAATEVRKTVIDLIYNYAFQMYHSRDHRTAVKYFDLLIERFPEDPKVENALYWIGECYYDRRDFDNAVAAFEQVLENRASTAKDPDALFKLGMIRFAVKDYAKALKHFDEVINGFPESRLVPQARAWREQTIRELKYQ